MLCLAGAAVRGNRPFDKCRIHHGITNIQTAGMITALNTALPAVVAIPFEAVTIMKKK